MTTDTHMRVDHISIAVKRIEAALAFFRQYFPIRMGREKSPGYDDSFYWCDFYLGDFKIELIESAKPQSFVERFLRKRGEGLHHLSLEVDNLDPVVKKMEAEGLRIVDKFDFGDGDKTAFISPRSAFGVLIQFWQIPQWPPEMPPLPPIAQGERIRMKVDHVSIAVRDIDTTLHFFRQFFPIEGGFFTHPGYDGTFNLTNFYLNGYKIELIENAKHRADGFVNRFIEKRGEGLHHISIDVDNLDPLIIEMEREGVRIVDKFDRGGGRKTAFISPRSAFGVLIQFWQEPSLTNR